jgi:hypothetical protein
MFANNMGIPIMVKPWGIHAGVWGLAANFLSIGVLSFCKRPTDNIAYSALKV